MNLEHLRSVCQVAKEGSVSLAAPKLHMTQSGVSRQLQRIEQELGVELFSRQHGRLELTPAGKRFLRFAENTLREYDEVLRDLRHESGVLSGDLLIASSSTPGAFLVGNLVARFVESYPAVSPRVTISDTDQVIEDLLERSCDVGFVGDRVADERLRFYVVDTDEIVLAVPAGHRFASRDTVALDELVGEPFIGREAGSGTLRTVRRAVARHGFTMPSYRLVMELGTIHAVLAAVSAGVGLGWVSKQVVKDEHPGRVTTVRIDQLPLDRSIFIVHHTRRPLPRAARTFLDWVISSP